MSDKSVVSSTQKTTGQSQVTSFNWVGMRFIQNCDRSFFRYVRSALRGTPERIEVSGRKQTLLFHWITIGMGSSRRKSLAEKLPILIARDANTFLVRYK